MVRTFFSAIAALVFGALGAQAASLNQVGGATAGGFAYAQFDLGSDVTGYSILIDVPTGLTLNAISAQGDGGFAQLLVGQASASSSLSGTGGLSNPGPFLGANSAPSEVVILSAAASRVFINGFSVASVPPPPPIPLLTLEFATTAPGTFAVGFSAVLTTLVADSTSNSGFRDTFSNASGGAQIRVTAPGPGVIPLPAGLLLSLTALGGLALMRRRRPG